MFIRALKPRKTKPMINIQDRGMSHSCPKCLETDYIEVECSCWSQGVEGPCRPCTQVVEDLEYICTNCSDVFDYEDLKSPIQISEEDPMKRMFLVYINKKPINFQVSQDAGVRFSHLYEKDVDAFVPKEIQRWDKQHEQNLNAKFTRPRHIFRIPST